MICKNEFPRAYTKDKRAEERGKFTLFFLGSIYYSCYEKFCHMQMLIHNSIILFQSIISFYRNLLASSMCSYWYSDNNLQKTAKLFIKEIKCNKLLEVKIYILLGKLANMQHSNFTALFMKNHITAITKPKLIQSHQETYLS